MTRGRLTEVLIREVAARQHGVISLWQLRAAGLADSTIVSRCRSGVLVRVLRAVYGFQPGTSDAGLAFAGLLGVGADRIQATASLRVPSLDEVLLLDPRYRVSHWTTLRLAGVIDYAPPAVDVTVVGARRGSRLPGVRGHRRLRMDPAEHTTIMGVPSFTVARACSRSPPKSRRATCAGSSARRSIGRCSIRRRWGRRSAPPRPTPGLGACDAPIPSSR